MESQKIRYTAIVRVSGSESNIRNACETVVTNVGNFCQLIIEFPAYNENENNMHKDWDRQFKFYKDIKVDFVGKIGNDLELNDLICKESAGVIEIPAYCLITKQSFNKWIQHVQSEDIPNTVTQFGLRPYIDLSEEVQKDSIIRSFMYGYLLVIFVWEWLWYRLERGKLYHSPNDVTLRLMVTNGNNRRFIAQRQSKSRYFFNDQCDYIQFSGEGGCIIRPPYSKRGKSYIYWTLSKHSHFVLGLWIFLFFFVLSYYAMFAVYTLRVLQVHKSITALFNGYTLTFIILQSLVHLLIVLPITKYRVQFDWMPLITILYPFYVMSFPVILIISKF